MVLIFNTVSFRNKQDLALKVAYYKALCKNLSREHSVILLYDDTRFLISGNNISALEVKSPTSNRLKFYFWFSAFLKKLSKENPGSVLISIGIPFAKISSQGIIFEPEIDLLKNRKSRVTSSILRKSLGRATKIAVFSKQDKPSGKNVTAEVYPPGRLDVAPLDLDERESAKNKVAAGNEFFLFYGYLEKSEAIITLLKAFSSFKKRQRSNMRLILAGKKGERFTELNTLLTTFRFKADVVFYDEDVETNLTEVFGSAYAIVVHSQTRQHISVLVAAMQMHVPLLVPVNSKFEEIVGNAVITYDDSGFENLGLKLISVFQDEKGRSESIDREVRKAESFDWNKSTQRLIH